MHTFHTRYSLKISGIMMLILLLANSASASTIIVPDDYVSIQGAIDNANPGDIIEVNSGTYYENVNVNKKLTLRGIGKPVVDARGSGSAITLAADEIMLEGFTAIMSGYKLAGIKITSKNNILSDNNASNNYDGISLSSSSNYNTLSGNNANSNSYHGIYLSSSSNNKIIGNNANSNNYMGIHLWSSNNNTLNDNNANSNNHFGIHLYDSSNFNTLSGNNANSNSDGIYLSSSSNNKLIENNANSNNELGIRLSSSSMYNNLSGNNANSNDVGIYLYPSSNFNTLIGNNANLNNYGIYLSSSSNNKLIGNNANSNNKNGIYLDYSSKNIIYNNIFNNTNNVKFYRVSIDTWNITKQPGTSIIGGSNLGGNFWAKPDGTGYSQKCEDVDADRICDFPFILDSNNIDYMSLACASDTSSPSSITDLTNISYDKTFINWTWTDPEDADFDKVMIYFNGTFWRNVTNGTQYYNATGLTPNMIYEISTRTLDIKGNINTTWINKTARTAKIQQFDDMKKHENLWDKIKSFFGLKI